MSMPIVRRESMAKNIMTLVFLVFFALFLSIPLQYGIIIFFDVLKIDRFLGEYALVLFIILPAFIVSLIPRFYSYRDRKLSAVTTLITFFVAGIILTSTIPKAGPNPYAVSYLTIPPVLRSPETATKTSDWINTYFYIVPKEYDASWIGSVNRTYHIAVFVWKDKTVGFIKPLLILSNKKRYCSEKFDIMEESLKSRDFKELNITIQREAYRKVLLSNGTVLIYLECSEKLGYKRLVFVEGNRTKMKKFIKFIENLR
ncbi:hypothetical protein [Thermococcus sp.]